MNDCIFCKIVAGEIPSYKVWEDDKWYAFLTINPHTPGHTLIIPKQHVDYFFDLSEELLSEVLVKATPIAGAIKQAFKPESGKVGVVVAGLEVPHAHLHLISMDNTNDLDFGNAKKATPEELAAAHQQLMNTLS
jgi:histidine triad (HIT) family protein